MLAVEVKGGGVSFDAATGAWHSVDRNGKRNTIKDPFKQASKERHALLDQITGHASWRQWTGARLTIGHAVMLPDIGDPTPFSDQTGNAKSSEQMQTSKMSLGGTIM